MGPVFSEQEVECQDILHRGQMRLGLHTSAWFAPNGDKPEESMEETSSSHSLFQGENPLLCFFRCDNAPVLSAPHPFNVVSHRADRFIVRCQACQRLYSNIEQTSILKEGIQPMGDIWLTHAIIAKTEETACHIRIGGIKDLGLVVSFRNKNLTTWFRHPHHF